MDDNFNFGDVNDFPGYISSKDKTNVNPAALVKGSQNVYKKLSGTIASRFGLKMRGSPEGVTTTEIVLSNTYPQSNYNDDTITLGGVQGGGQSFIAGYKGSLDSCKFYLRKVGSPTGDAIARIYNTTIDPNDPPKLIPTGVALASSDPLDVSTISASQTMTELIFSGTNRIQLTQGATYFLTLEYLGGAFSDYILMGGNSPGTDSTTNEANLTVDIWYADLADLIYELYVEVSSFVPTEGGVVSSDEWITSLGGNRVLRMLENGELQVEVDVSGVLTWITLITLSLTRAVFDTYWDVVNSKDFLLFVVGDANIYKWGGGVSFVGSNTATTITKQNNATTWQQDGFDTTGNVIIDGATYAYTGISMDGLTLTGLSALPTFTTGDTVLLGVVTQATTPTNGTNFTNDFIKTIGNQLYVGSYRSRVIYVSGDDTGSNGDWTNYVVASPPLYGSPEQITLDQLANGIGVHDGNPHIFSGTSQVTEVIYYDVNISENVGGTPYTILTRGTKLNKTIMPVLYSALAHEFIDSIGNDIVFLSQDQQVRVLGTFKDIFGTPKYPSLSQAIQDELMNVDFTGGHLRAVGEFIYITAPKIGTHYLHQTRESVNENGLVVAERLWHPPQVCNLSRIAVISGIVYGHSNSQPQIYQLYNTNQWHDDSPSGDPIPYNSVAAFAYQHIAEKKRFRRNGLQKFDKVYSEGYMSPGTNLFCNVLFDYQGATSIQNVIVNSVQSPAEFMSGSNAPSIGDSSLGDDPLGDGIIASPNSQDLLPKFYSINDINMVNCFEYQLQFYSSDVDSRWELIAEGTNAVLADDQQAVFIRH